LSYAESDNTNLKNICVIYDIGKYRAQTGPRNHVKEKIMGKCPDERWMRHKDSCYLLKRDIQTWENARMKCNDEADGSTLASILTCQENQFLYELVHQEHLDRAWIGLKKEHEMSFWTWTSDNSIDLEYARWSPIHVDRYAKAGCVAIDNEKFPAQWRSFSCDDRYTDMYPYICQVKAIPVAEKSSSSQPLALKIGLSLLISFVVIVIICLLLREYRKRKAGSHSHARPMAALGDQGSDAAHGLMSQANESDNQAVSSSSCLTQTYTASLSKQ